MKKKATIASLALAINLTITIGAFSIAADTSKLPGGVEGISLSDPNLTVELIDSHPEEFFLCHEMDLKGRLYLGSREAVFLYDRTDTGGFQPRKELYRFPKDTWVYDLEAFGDDLLVLTNTALYRLRDALGAEPTLEKILWGNPLGHHHQGMHGIEFAPDGALLIALGDPHPNVQLDKTRPDHFWLWTWYVGPENRPSPYAGVGAVMRLDLDSYDFSVYAGGLRNPCGISFDRDWNLFANDNDQEGSTATPCRLVHVPRHSWNGWARGWDAGQNPARLDMIPNVNWALDVPVGQGYYDDTVLGEAYRGSLFVANWGNRSVSHHPLQPEGAGFRAEALPFLRADGDRRPVSAMPTNDGHLIVSLCYMKGNEGSPYRQTDLLLVSPKKSPENSTYDYTDKSLIELLSEPIQIRAKAHREILRQGGSALEEAAKAFADTDPDSAKFSSLIFLAAAHGDAASVDRISSLARGDGRSAELAWRAAAAWPDKFPGLTDEVIEATALKQDEPKLLAGLLEYLYSAKRSIPDSVARLAAHDDPFVRQSAAILLARQAPNDQLTAFAGGDADQRLASTLATVFRIWERAEAVRELPEGGEIAIDKRMMLLHPEGPINLRDLGEPVGTYRMEDWWRSAEVKKTNQAEFDRLKNALADSEQDVVTAAATGLFFLNDERVDAEVASVLRESEITLSMVAGKMKKADLKKALRALKGAKLSTGIEVPEAFRSIDWDSESAPKGNIEKGKELFAQRACVACHLAPHDGVGGAIGPTLVGVGNRFPPSYLAASILVPNLTVSPNFHPNTVTMKDGTIHTGFVEAGAAPGMINLRVITGQKVELDKREIAKQDASEQSMMPAGLVQTPEEMADLIAYMRKKRGKAARKKALQSTLPPAALMGALSDWETTGNWQVDEDGTFALTPRPGEVDWKRYGDYLWSKKSYQNFEITFEYKHEKDGNSGLYFNVEDRQSAVKSVIEVQIRDSAGETKLNAHGTCGGILPGIIPTTNAAKPAGEWNQMAVRGLDGLVTVTLNGTLVNETTLTHPKLNTKPKQGYIGFQDHGLPFWLRKITIREFPSSSSPPSKPEDPSTIEIQRHIDSIKPNSFSFLPTEAKYVRVDVLGSSKGQPCIDELEVYSADSPKNLALQSNGAKATASSLLKGHDKHQIEHLNDGKCGNSNSWISAKKSGWAQIELPEVVTIDRVVLSRDRGGSITGRTPTSIDILVSNDAKEWKTVKKVRPRKAPAQKKRPVIKEAAAPVKPEKKVKPSGPNVVLILSDDMGYSDLPKFGKSEIPTPHIDRLADQGTLFTNAYVTAPVCVVSRMGLLSGQNQQRFGIYDNIYGEDKVRLFLEQTLVQSVFQKAGYRTGLIGKWHLNGNKKQQYKNGSPLQRGFDEFVGIHGGDSAFWKGTPVYRNNDPESFPAPEYLTDYWGSEACEFVDRNQSKPFFLYLAYNAVHAPMHALDDDREPFANVEDENRRTYNGMLLAMDRSIGRVLDRLDKHGIADKTIVVFLNDNGGGGSTDLYAAHSRNYANNQPLRGHKFDVLEGGVRVPMVMRWPGQVPAGQVYGKMTSSTDVYPTLVQAAGLEMPKDQPTDGVDLLPYLKGENSNKPHEWLCWQNRSWLARKKGGSVVPTRKVHNSAIRKENWKLVRLNEKIGSDASPPAWKLYDLSSDIGESNDIAAQHEDRVEELSALFETWRASMHPTVE